jgi:recombinational DNA repair ATPase RecF
MNSVQTVAVDPAVTVLVGMNEAGKTVLLKALQKSADALGEESFEPIEDYPRKDLSAYLKTHKTQAEVAVSLTYALNDDEIGKVNAKLGTSLESGHQLTLSHRYDNTKIIGLTVDESPLIKGLSGTLSTDARCNAQGLQIAAVNSRPFGQYKPHRG